MSSFIKSQSLIKRLETSSDVVDAIQNGQNKSNENRILRGDNYILFCHINCENLKITFDCLRFT